MERKNSQGRKPSGKAGGQTEKVKTIGVNVDLPSVKCKDKKCPFHGHIKIRGRAFDGEVLTKDTHKTVVVGWQRLVKIRKYERYAKKKTRVMAHNPECINANIGERVTIIECRPLSKTKHFVIVSRE